MNACFADTSYYLALLVPQDNNHQAATRIARTLRRPVVTSEFVLLEVGNFLSGTRVRSKLGDFLEALRRDGQTTIVPVSPAALRRGFDLYLARPDKTWSVTDCISFVLMDDMGLRDALTTDHHFEQAGYNTFLNVGS